jgi:hypothetical protein
VALHGGASASTSAKGQQGVRGRAQGGAGGHDETVGALVRLETNNLDYHGGPSPVRP